MSNPRLPPEILDWIVDFLHDDPKALEGCCLVSKSWIPRARKHIFDEVSFITMEKLQSWKEMFPDPLNSPAYHTRTLSVVWSRKITATYCGAGERISGFSRVVQLRLAGQGLFPDPALSFALLHGFSPVVKSLSMNFAVLPPSQIFHLVLSFPLLEDLSIITYSNPLTGDELPTIDQPPSPLRLTGSLELSMGGGMGPIARWLLSIPGGVHFRELSLEWFREEDPLLTMELLEKCSNTIDSLKITCDSRGTSIQYLCLFQ